MIDLHCHILPGIDDGAKTIDESLQMAKTAVQEGITHIVATPHHMKNDWINVRAKIETLTLEVQRKIDEEKLPLTLFPGQEIRIYNNILTDIVKEEILFVDEGKQYILIEFPPSHIPVYTKQLFYELELKGMIPIIVHPERNKEILEHPNKLKELVNKGALAQLTASSYTGELGKNVQRLSKQFIEANLVHFIASDAHNTSDKSFHMKEAYEKLAKDYGKEKSNQFQQITKDLINGNTIIPPSPTKIKKRSFFGFL
ncbi:tyrosine-protein phosphatase [Marinilactibacillus sp. GCM10026970]|uniref:tyrosine-protein phosphatase n=1 Tax=Marinilactibacillus sp. GCM10026970 TaxID=3252642 RepID=UPI003615B46A